MNLDLIICSASDQFFFEAIGHAPKEIPLEEVVASCDKNIVLGWKDEFWAEQQRMDPNYLPPIRGMVEKYIRTLASEQRVVKLHRHRCLVFTTSIGQCRNFAARIGLMKETSYFFVAMALVRDESWKG
jgi:hypothetical protein